MPPPINTSERVYQELRQMVVSGDLAPGDRLVQRQLAERLGVSSIPIIEATRRLQHDGLVVQHPNWGAQVRQWTEADIEGAYLAREALEGVACRLFVQRAGRVEKMQLVELAESFCELVRQKDRGGWLEADLALHSHIVHSCHADALIHIVEGSCLITLTLRNAHRKRVGEDAMLPEPGVHDHLVAALLGDDPERAEQAGRLHVRIAYDRLLATKPAE